MGFKTFRAPEGKPEAAPRWQRMRKGIADLHRRTQVSQAANERYLRAIASVENTASLGELAAHLSQPTTRNGRVRPLNPYAPADATLLQAISRGEFSINGFRNRDLRPLLFGDTSASGREQHRQAAAVSRKLFLLRAHRLIRKLPHTHRYHLTAAGRQAAPRRWHFSRSPPFAPGKIVTKCWKFWLPANQYPEPQRHLVLKCERPHRRDLSLRSAVRSRQAGQLHALDHAST
jgi:hypothetical protein